MVSMSSDVTFPEKKEQLQDKVVTKKGLRVAFFSSLPADMGSGCEHLIYDTAKALIARGHDARIYLMTRGKEENKPSFVHQIPTVPFERAVAKRLARLTGINDMFFPSTVLLRFGPWLSSADIWHFHNLHANYISLPLLGLLSWTKRIIISPVDQYLSTGYCPYTIDCTRYRDGCGSCPRLAEPYPGISRDTTHFLWKVKRLFFRKSNVGMLFHTRALAAHYAETFVGCRPSRTIHYGIDVNEYRIISRSACSVKLGISQSSRFVVGLFHSDITDPRKGILPLVKALSDLSDRLSDSIHLLVVGHGSYAVRATASLNLQVTSLPFIKDPQQLAAALNLCDVLLYPTRAENLSLTCLSALACGVPVITYDVGGQSEAVLDGVNGFVVPVNDSGAMLEALTRMVLNPQLCRQLSEGARRTAEEGFDFDRYIDDLITYYNEQVRTSIPLR
ncbi:MAG: glycosyltransferase [Nitrospiraceae bacterium]|nr:glycosyltransferase [Nitrospiraceae bacterium]